MKKCLVCYYCKGTYKLEQMIYPWDSDVGFCGNCETSFEEDLNPKEPIDPFDNLRAS